MTAGCGSWDCSSTSSAPPRRSRRRIPRRPPPTTATTPLTPLAAVHQLRRLFSATLRDLPAVQAPALVFKSDTDTVVPPSSLALLRRRLGSRELTVVPLPHSGHVATLDADAPLLFEESVRFFLQHAPTAATAHAPPPAPSETP